jgi:hypothetical protein
MTDMAETGQLRTRAVDHVRAGRWTELLALEPDLRADGEFWPAMWGPVCAIARWHCGRADARDLLEECIAAGIYEPDFGTLFETSFGTEPDWAAPHARIAASVPPPPVELIRWPCARPVLPLGLAPDLAAIGTGVADHQGPALVFTTDHPYATGFLVTDAGGGTTTVPPAEPFPLAREAGEYRLTVAVTTRYGTLAPQPLHYVVR